MSLKIQFLYSHLLLEKKVGALSDEERKIYHQAENKWSNDMKNYGMKQCQMITIGCYTGVNLKISTRESLIPKISVGNTIALFCSQ